MKELVNKKTIIILLMLIILLLCIIILKCVFSSNEKYIILDDYIIEYDNNTIKKTELNKAIGSKFRIVSSDNYIGNYVLDHVDSSTKYLFFKNDDGVNSFKNPILGLDSNTDYISFETKEMTEVDFNLFKSIYSRSINNGIKDLTDASKTIIDNNGKKIYVYTIKYEGNNPEDDYSALFIKDDYKTTIIDEDISQKVEGGYILCSFKVEYLLDMNKDSKLELIVSKSIYDKTEYSIYSLDDSYKELYYTGV